MARIYVEDVMEATGIVGSHADLLGRIRRARIDYFEAVMSLIRALDMADPRAWRVLVVAASELGRSDEELGTEFMISHATLWRWRNGETVPREGVRFALRDLVLEMAADATSGIGQRIPA